MNRPDSDSNKGSAPLSNIYDRICRLGDDVARRAVLRQEMEIEALRDEVLASGALPGDFGMVLVFDRRLSFPRTRVRLV